MVADVDVVQELYFLHTAVTLSLSRLFVVTGTAIGGARCLGASDRTEFTGCQCLGDVSDNYERDAPSDGKRKKHH